MCNISFCDVDSKVDQFFQPTLYIIVIVLGLPTNCMALWAAYMQVRRTHTHAHTHTRIATIHPEKCCNYSEPDTFTILVLSNQSSPQNDCVNII